MEKVVQEEEDDEKGGDDGGGTSAPAKICVTFSDETVDAHDEYFCGFSHLH